MRKIVKHFIKNLLPGTIIISGMLISGTLNSCEDTSDDITGTYNFGYVKIINNTPDNHFISIDSNHSYYCDYIKRWGEVFCDLPVGWHTIQFDGLDSCSWYINIRPGQTEYLQCDGK